MDVYEAIINRRTVRKFTQEKIDKELLLKMINGARLAPMGANVQSLRYCIIDEAEVVNQVSGQVKWAGHIRPEGDPKEGEQPTAYIAVLADTEIKKAGHDAEAGAAVQNIMLIAKSEGIGSCWMGAINRDEIRRILNIDEKYLLKYVIALGYEGEKPVTEVMLADHKYYKDTKGVLHVPKLELEDVLENNQH